MFSGLGNIPHMAPLGLYKPKLLSFLGVVFTFKFVASLVIISTSGRGSEEGSSKPLFKPIGRLRFDFFSENSSPIKSMLEIPFLL